MHVELRARGGRRVCIRVKSRYSYYRIYHRVRRDNNIVLFDIYYTPREFRKRAEKS